MLPAAAAVVVLASPRIGAVKLSEAAQIKAAYQASCRAAWAGARKAARRHLLPHPAAAAAAAVGSAPPPPLAAGSVGDGLPFARRMARVAASYIAGCDIDAGALHRFFSGAAHALSRHATPAA